MVFKVTVIYYYTKVSVAAKKWAKNLFMMFHGTFLFIIYGFSLFYITYLFVSMWLDRESIIPVSHFFFSFLLAHTKFLNRDLGKIATGYEMILKNSYNFKKFKN